MALAMTCRMMLTLILTLTPLMSGLTKEEALRIQKREAQSLLNFKQKVSDPDKKLQSWVANSPNPCSWKHITCDERNMTALVEIPRSNLGGVLFVPEPGIFEFLYSLDLGNNRFEGNIPAALGGLKNLMILSLERNRLSGNIPPSLGNLKKLLEMRLNDNRLTGRVPSALAPGAFPNIRSVNFANNANLCWDFWPDEKYIGKYTLCQAK